LPRTLIFMDATTGLRQSELFGLRWRDLDFDGGQMNVVRSVVQGAIDTTRYRMSALIIPYCTQILFVGDRLLSVSLTFPPFDILPQHATHEAKW
jgi:integrase